MRELAFIVIVVLGVCLADLEHVLSTFYLHHGPRGLLDQIVWQPGLELLVGGQGLSLKRVCDLDIPIGLRRRDNKVSSMLLHNSVELSLHLILVACVSSVGYG